MIHQYQCASVHKKWNSASCEEEGVVVQMLFSSSERLLGTEHALLLALVGLIPPVAPWALDFLHLWRARCAPSPFAPRVDPLRCQITRMSLTQ